MQVRSVHRILVLVALIGASLTRGDQAAAQVIKGAPLPVVPRPLPTDAPQRYDATELDRILSPIALYPDPLLAQLLTAATFSSQLPMAMRWSEGRPGLSGETLTDALTSEQVSWDPSVQAMLAFPPVLEMMASNMPWTEEIGDAFQRQPGDVMDAVQRLRAESQRHGYLRSNEQLQVTTGETIEILPVNPTYIVVPYYDPLVVYLAPRPRFVVGSAIYFGYGVRLGHWFEPWGRGPGGFHWTNRRVVYGYPGWGRPWNGYSRGYGRSVFYSPRYAPRSDSRGGGYDRGGWSRDGARRDGSIDWSRDGDSRYDSSDRGDRAARDNRLDGSTRPGRTDGADRTDGSSRTDGDPRAGTPIEWSRNGDSRNAPRRGSNTGSGTGSSTDARRDERRGAAGTERRSDSGVRTGRDPRGVTRATPSDSPRGVTRGTESRPGRASSPPSGGSARTGGSVSSPRSGRPSGSSRASGSSGSGRGGQRGRNP